MGRETLPSVPEHEVSRGAPPKRLPGLSSSTWDCHSGELLHGHRKSFRQHNEAGEFTSHVPTDLGRMMQLNWRFVIFSDALWCGAAAGPDRKIPPLSIYASSYRGPFAYCRVTQTSFTAKTAASPRLSQLYVSNVKYLLRLLTVSQRLSFSYF